MRSYHDIDGDGGSNVVGQVAGQQERLAARMASVRHIVAVMSGKGGVGKSSVTVNLAAALAAGGHRVGIMDADINGSSIPQMLGVRGARPERSGDGVTPPAGALGIRAMSVDFFLRNDEAPVTWKSTAPGDAYTWRGMMEMGALREMLSDTAWGALDYLLVDVPPGTDKLPNMVDLLPRISAAVLVSIPSGVSQFVVGKSLHMAVRLLKTRIAGLVENMSAYVCPACGTETALFPGEGLEPLASRFGIPFLGKIPFDPRMAAMADAGQPYVTAYPDAPAAAAIRAVADGVAVFLQTNETKP